MYLYLVNVYFHGLHFTYTGNYKCMHMYKHLYVCMYICAYVRARACMYGCIIILGFKFQENKLSAHYTSSKNKNKKA